VGLAAVHEKSEGKEEGDIIIEKKRGEAPSKEKDIIGNP